jgi:hypothetical protein
VKTPKKAVKILKYLDDIEEILRFSLTDDGYTKCNIMHDCEDGKVRLKDAMNHIRDYVETLSEDQKVQNVRLWNKFKQISGIKDE